MRRRPAVPRATPAGSDAASPGCLVHRDGQSCGTLARQPPATVVGRLCHRRAVSCLVVVPWPGSLGHGCVFRCAAARMLATPRRRARGGMARQPRPSRLRVCAAPSPLPPRHTCALRYRQVVPRITPQARAAARLPLGRCQSHSAVAWPSPATPSSVVRRAMAATCRAAGHESSVASRSRSGQTGKPLAAAPLPTTRCRLPAADYPLPTTPLAAARCRRRPPNCHDRPSAACCPSRCLSPRRCRLRATACCGAAIAARRDRPARRHRRPLPWPAASRRALLLPLLPLTSMCTAVAVAVFARPLLQPPASDCPLLIAAAATAAAAACCCCCCGLSAGR